jgi:hypothetical protein
MTEEATRTLKKEVQDWHALNNWLWDGTIGRVDVLAEIMSPYRFLRNKADRERAHEHA